MAVICAKVGIVGNGANVLANRWFQPLTHVSEARTPRESARAGQEGKREKREISGSSWHMLRHSLFTRRSDKEMTPTACRRPGSTKTHWRCEMGRFKIHEAEGFIYFIASASGPIKIGFATKPKARLNTMQTGNADDLFLVATTPGGTDLERRYHHRFAAHRLRGEWFSPHPSILAEIDRLTDDGKW